MNQIKALHGIEERVQYIRTFTNNHRGRECKKKVIIILKIIILKIERGVGRLEEFSPFLAVGLNAVLVNVLCFQQDSSLAHISLYLIGTWHSKN